MYVRAPASLTTNPANFDILVVNQSASSNATDSSPMVVMLRARKIYTVAVTVTGDGKVTSQPGGIQCGTSPLGHSLTDCSFDFGPGQVTLAAQDNDPNSITFSGWTGNCPAMSQTCVLTLDGTARMVANASFGAGSAPTGSTCSAAPPVSGWRWIGTPGCSDPGFHPGITLQCDAAGYFCCAPGNPGNPRCNGEQLIQADCRNQPNQGINARLIPARRLLRGGHVSVGLERPESATSERPPSRRHRARPPRRAPPASCGSRPCGRQRR